jgi:acyl-CoA thioester hydrolase
MPSDILDRVSAMQRAHADLPRPDGVGRRIGIPRKSA